MVKCELCDETKKCIKYFGEWVCKDCYSDMYGTGYDWDEKFESVKDEEMYRRKAQAEQEWNEIIE